MKYITTCIKIESVWSDKMGNIFILVIFILISTLLIFVTKVQFNVLKQMNETLMVIIEVLTENKCLDSIDKNINNNRTMRSGLAPSTPPPPPPKK